MSQQCTSSAAFFGAMGAASALVFANLGAAYGTAKAGVGVAHLGIMNHTKVCPKDIFLNNSCAYPQRPVLEDTAEQATVTRCHKTFNKGSERVAFTGHTCTQLVAHPMLFGQDLLYVRLL